MVPFLYYPGSVSYCIVLPFDISTTKKLDVRLVNDIDYDQVDAVADDTLTLSLGIYIRVFLSKKILYPAFPPLTIFYSIW